ncbi:MmcQ/YjbR family DNA-binding protein [Pseudenhygromyxa sp. WMMC2535]|uniref:MmcQ/YjbR family DNA-binding protein n=1 Tax=Pseudenhygromyxa sp. WMMC2535 TaxID=2712867 RepID=UPI0015544590|nr:MmcQ/YjbR family DNA-binding protein [Pseudenhygromyxa sp. WMMC2535]NVB41429.1 MmcQ/YjbR family DNA-binding protein [Pseudenhygromyxa sp. WMMC2535]
MNESKVDPRVLAKLRAICLALPEAVEEPAHGDPAWRVRKKIFVSQKGNYADGRPSAWMKAAEGAQTALITAAPDVFFAPPYVGSRGWIGVWLDVPIDWKGLEELIHDSYRLIAPRTLAKQI